LKQKSKTKKSKKTKTTQTTKTISTKTKKWLTKWYTLICFVPLLVSCFFFCFAVSTFSFFSHSNNKKGNEKIFSTTKKSYFLIAVHLSFSCCHLRRAFRIPKKTKQKTQKT
jgi:hypothetical protein